LSADVSNFPLGNFSQNAPIDAGALAAARSLYTKITQVPPSLLSRIYLHWSVEPMNCVDASYNIVVNMPEPGHFALSVAADPANNAPGVNNDPESSHTYMRNTGAVGIALDGMDGATEDNFGPDGVTVMGLTFLCAATAAVAKKYDIDITGISSAAPYGGELNVLTHAEAGNLCGNPAQYAPYGPQPIGDGERWDLAAFIAGPADATTAGQCGSALRALAHAYKLAL
jgi:hypothetical protein